MSEDAEGELAGLSRVPLKSQSLRGSRGGSVERLREPAPHGVPVGRLRPAAAGVAAVEGDDGLPYAEVLAAETVVVLGVVARVAEGCVDPDQPGCLSHGGRDVRGVLARADPWHRPEDEVRASMDKRR